MIRLYVEIYPREGTETGTLRRSSKTIWLKFIPVRGRKRSWRARVASVVVEIYPREGTETGIPASGLPVPTVEIYPREGTETRCRLFVKLLFLLKFIPVRGRKRTGSTLPVK